MDLPAKVTLHGKAIRKGRISPALATAIRLIEEEGYSIADAAERTDYKVQSLYNALLKPHVKMFRADVKRAHLASEAPKAWNRITDLATTAQSEKVRLEANKTVLGVLGELNDERPEDAPSTLINITQTVVNMGDHPLTQRLPGVVQADDYVDVPFEPL